MGKKERKIQEAIDRLVEVCKENDVEYLVIVGDDDNFGTACHYSSANWRPKTKIQEIAESWDSILTKSEFDPDKRLKK